MNKSLKRVFTSFIAFTLCLALLPVGAFFTLPVQAATAPKGYTVIRTEADLRNIDRNASSRKGKYWLANDIELSREWKPISNFKGTFEGNGYTISNLHINNPKKSNQGLFRKTDKAIIKNLEIQVSENGIRGKYRVGALVGMAKRSTIIGVSVQVGGDGVVGGKYVGGMVGKASKSTIVGCYSYGHNGLIEVYEDHPEPRDVIAIRGTKTATTHTGGLIGDLRKSSLFESTSYLNVTGYRGIGGLVGHTHKSTVGNSYARGYVLGQTKGEKNKYGEQIGGLIGENKGKTTINNVYSSGVVESLGKRRINPLVGRVSGRFTSTGMSFYDAEVSMNSSRTTQDLSSIRNRLVTGESTEMMKLQSTFEDSVGKWDFEGIWTIGLNHGTPNYVHTYPYFRGDSGDRSRPPIINEILEGDSVITGFGHSANAIIRVTLPDRTTVLETRTNAELVWSVTVPRGVTLLEDEIVTATQQEEGKAESTEAIAIVQKERLVEIEADKESENISDEERGSGLNYADDTIRYSIVVSNDGNEDRYADRIVITDVLPVGVTFVANSVSYTIEDDEGEEFEYSVPQNTSNISTRGHSYNASTRTLEIRLGTNARERLYGGESMLVEFEVTIDESAKGTTIAPNVADVTVRPSVSNRDNITDTRAEEEEGRYVEPDPPTTRTVTGSVSPVVFEHWGFGEEFLKEFETKVELRTDFWMPATDDLTTVVRSDSKVGTFTFEDVEFGEYILYITRPGYLTRTMKVTISENDPEIIFLNPPGDVVFSLLGGDLNGDGIIDAFDLLAMGPHFGAQWGDPNYVALFDLNGDGIIDQQDLDIVFDSFDSTILGSYPGAYWPILRRAFTTVATYDLEAMKELFMNLGSEVFNYTLDELIAMPLHDADYAEADADIAIESGIED